MWEGGVARLSASGALERVWRGKDGLRVETTIAIAASRAGEIFVLNREGVFTLNEAQQFERITSNNQTVSAIHLDASDTLWTGGPSWYMARWDRQRREFVNVKLSSSSTLLESLKNDSVLRILSSSADELFVLSTKAIVQISRDGQVVKHWSLAPIIGSAVPSDLALLASERDRVASLLIGTSDGLFRIKLAFELLDIRAEPVITGLRMFNKPLRLAEPEAAQAATALFANQLVLPYDQDLLSFEFATQPLPAYTKPRFRYRLLPFDRQWIEAASDEPRASYTRLPPGQYGFSVQAGNASQWQGISAEFKLQFLPPWWLTWWAKTLWICGVLCSAFALYRMRTRALRKQTEWLELRVQARTQELQTANQMLGDIAKHDSLTRLLNRRGFTAAVEKLGWSALTENAALMIGDIDHFKSINDSFGHDVGDEVLVELAKRLQHASQSTDVIARWGGEEFILLLVGEKPLQRAAQLHDAIAATPMHLSIGERLVSMTAGCVSLQGAPFETCLKQADALLYLGKQSGRNRMVTEL
jgi:diguanylate cyclase (GGDEF)-like protein